MNLTNEELLADKKAENAALALHNFLVKHESYFEFSGRTDPISGRLLVEKNVVLDRQLSALHRAAADANKRALDLEYANRMPE